MVMEICYGEGCFTEEGGGCQIWKSIGGGGAAQGWCPNLVQGPYGVCLWKSIRKGWDVFCGCVSFKV